MKKLITYLAITLFCASCADMFEDYDKRTYYNVKVVGYVCHYETKEPIPNVRVLAESTFRSNGWGTVPPQTEEYRADGSGYFCIKFIKRTHKENAISHSISVNMGVEGYYSDIFQHFTAEELLNAKSTIYADTVWVKKNLIVIN